MSSHYRWCILVTLNLAFISGCFHLPSPSTETVDDKLSLVKPIEMGDTICIYGNNASRPGYFGEPYFTMGCMLDFKNDTIEQLTRYMLLLNPVPGQFAIKELRELQGAEPFIKFSEPILTELYISESKALKERLRYVIFVNEKIDTAIHMPLYIIPFGIAACGNETVLEATIWEVPSGNLIGTITASSKGEFLGLAYMLHVVFIPQTQSGAALKLAQEILKKLTGLNPDEKNIPSWQYR
jgi:hypothetical protein